MNSATFKNGLTWEQILDAVNLGLILLDNQGKILLWNDWVAEHSGITAKLALTHSLESLFPDELSTSFKAALRNALQQRLPIVLSNALHRSPLPLYSLPIKKDDGIRMNQSIAISPIIVSDEEHYCLIHVTGNSISINRERVLKTHTERLSQEATTDALTGAYNRRFFNGRYESEFGRAQRQNTELSLLMIDLDYFKNYNDHYGHVAGDKALIAVVDTLQKQLNRPTDILVRYGGEEFAVILPDTGREGGQAIAEKLREAVANLNIPHEKSEIADRVTVSIGIATYQPGTPSNTTLVLEAADAALYAAKTAGRNCVRFQPA